MGGRENGAKDLLPEYFCRSTNIVPVSTKTKFSVGRAVVGGTVGSLFNPLGTIIGAASGINGKKGERLNFYVRIAEKFLSEKYKMGAVIT